MKHTEKELQKIAAELRLDVMDMGPKSGNVCHVAPAFSCTEIVTALYFEVLNIRPEEPEWPDRDRFIISKGHACPVVYAALAKLGYFPHEDLWTVKCLGSRLQGHPDCRKLPGIDMTSGSLGNGFAAGLGMALAAKIQKKNFKVFAILGDGEFQEGIVMEAMMAAPAKGADNLIAILDYNHLQSSGSVTDIMPLDPMADKWRAFGWHVLECNGHDFRELISCMEVARNYAGRPTVIIANTTKGKGVSFIEHNNAWHAKMPTAEEYALAAAELNAQLAELIR